MKKHILSFIIAVIFICVNVNAQDYGTGIGVRGGLWSGLTVKHFVKETMAIEGILSYGYRGYQITGLFEVHGKAFEPEGLYFYYGGGVHFGTYSGRGYYNWWATNYVSNMVALGIDGILGLEYQIPTTPLVGGIDIKPYIQARFPGNSFFPRNYFDTAISLRYTF